MKRLLTIILVGLIGLALAPFPSIPMDAVPFYVSDSATIFTTGAPVIQFSPGPMNTDGQVVVGQQVTVYLTAMGCGVMPVANGANGVNMDVQIGFVHPVTHAFSVVGFGSPYGTAQNGQLAHCTGMWGVYGQGQLRASVEAPVVLRGTAPAWCTPCILGAVLTFHQGGIQGVPVQYEYAVQGAAKYQ